MATAYSGFATRKLEDLYNVLISKCFEMLSLKLLFSQGNGDFLTEELREKVSDEKMWAKKLCKLYRTLRKLEDRKYHGGHFAKEIRQLTSYFAVKHMLWPLSGEPENLSVFSSDAVSRYSSPAGGARSPKYN